MDMSIARSLLMTMLLLGSAATVTGCNTIQGMGQDMEAAGEEVQEEAEENDGDSEYE